MELTNEEFEALSKDMQKVLEAHNVEIIIRSELSFKKIETNGDSNETKTEEVKTDS